MLAFFLKSEVLIYTILMLLLIDLTFLMQWFYYSRPKMTARVFHIKARSYTTYTTHKEPYSTVAYTRGTTTHTPARDVTGAELSTENLRAFLICSSVVVVLAIAGTAYGGQNIAVEINKTVQSLYRLMIGF